MQWHYANGLFRIILVKQPLKKFKPTVIVCKNEFFNHINNDYFLFFGEDLKNNLKSFVTS